MLADLGRDGFGRIYTWHVGVQSPLCGANGLWVSRLERAPSAYKCPRCLTMLGGSSDAELPRFGVRIRVQGATARPTHLVLTGWVALLGGLVDLACRLGEGCAQAYGSRTISMA